MNDEIKEILDLLKDTADLSFFAVCGTKEEMENMPKCVSKRLAITDKQAKTLLDYITNLQMEIDQSQEIMAELTEENERLNNLFEYNMQTLVNTDKLYEDYKSRCEKASEKSQELKDSIDKSNFDGMTKTILILGINQIQNILQNGSEEND